MTEQAAERDLFSLGEFVFRNLPGAEAGVDVSVQVEHAGFDEMHGGHGADGLAYGPGLKERVEGDGIGLAEFLDAIGLGPDDVEIIEDGDADAADVVEIHPGLDVHLPRLAADLDAGNAGLNSGEAGGLCRSGQPYRSLWGVGCER